MFHNHLMCLISLRLVGHFILLLCYRTKLAKATQNQTWLLVGKRHRLNRQLLGKKKPHSWV